MAISNLSIADFNATVNGCMVQVNLKKTDWSIAQPDIDVITPLLTEWNTKYNATLNKKMASAADREARDVARQNLEPEFSKFIEKDIYLNSAMNDGDIKSCGLEPRKKTHTPSTKPASIPQMEYRQGQSHSLKAYYHQEPGANGSSRRGKPKGVDRCEIAYKLIQVDDNKPNPNPEPDPDPNGKDKNPITINPDDLAKRILGRKNPIILQFLPADAGRYVVLFARWVGKTDLNGDWGQMEIIMIP